MDDDLKFFLFMAGIIAVIALGVVTYNIHANNVYLQGGYHACSFPGGQSMWCR
jgi:hypothetical protein